MCLPIPGRHVHYDYSIARRATTPFMELVSTLQAPFHLCHAQRIVCIIRIVCAASPLGKPRTRPGNLETDLLLVFLGGYKPPRPTCNRRGNDEAEITRGHCHGRLSHLFVASRHTIFLRPCPLLASLLMSTNFELLENPLLSSSPKVHKSEIHRLQTKPSRKGTFTFFSCISRSISAEHSSF